MVAMKMSLVQQKQALAGQSLNARKPLSFRASRPAQMGVRAASAAAAPPATGVIADKNAELAINGETA